MATDIWRDFDPNLEIPYGLKNVNVKPTVQEGTVVETFDEPAIDDGIDIIEDEIDDDLNEDFSNDILDPPDSLVIVSQTVRTAPDGRQVVDVVVEVEDIPSALNYDIRVTTT